MATHGPLVPPRDLIHYLQSRGGGGRDYLTMVSDFVSSYRGKSCRLNNPDGATWKVGGLDDTIFKEKYSEADEWGKFYLPNEVNMKVVGEVKGTSCPCSQLVLMTCEDKKIYGYDGEELHLVASSFEQLGERGVEYPASKSYYNGEAFKNMTEQDWEKVRRGHVGRSLDEAHRKLVMAEKSKLLANLK